MPIAELDGVSIYYDRPVGTGAPLLMFGGMAGQLVNFPDRVVTAFAASGIDPIRIDLRDAGMSTHFPAGPDYSLFDCAHDVAQLVSYLGIDNAHLLGSGYGALIAQVAAVEFPDRVRSLILAQSHTGEDDVVATAQGVVDAFFRVLEPCRDDEMRERRYVSLLEELANGDAVEPGELRRFVRALFQRDPGFSSTGRFLAAVGSTEPWAHRLRKISVPVLVVHGTGDPFISVSGGQRTAALIAHARFVAIDGVGHYLSSAFWNTAIGAIVDHVAAVERGELARH